MIERTLTPFSPCHTISQRWPLRRDIDISPYFAAIIYFRRHAFTPAAAIAAIIFGCHIITRYALRHYAAIISLLISLLFSP